VEHALAGFLAKFTYLAIFGVLTAAGWARRFRKI